MASATVRKKVKTIIQRLIFIIKHIWQIICQSGENNVVASDRHRIARTVRHRYTVTDDCEVEVSGNWFQFPFPYQNNVVASDRHRIAVNIG